MPRLPAHRGEYRRWHGRRIIEERPHEAHRGELQSESETVDIAALLDDLRVIAVIEVEVPGQLFGLTGRPGTGRSCRAAPGSGSSRASRPPDVAELHKRWFAHGGATSAGNPTFTGCKTVLHYQARMQYLYAIMAPQTGRSTTVAGGSLMVKPVPDLEAVVEAAARPTSRRPTRADCPDVAAGRHRADHDSRGSGDPDAAEDAGGRTADDCTSPRLRGPQCRVRAAPQAGDCEVKTGPRGLLTHRCTGVYMYLRGPASVSSTVAGATAEA